MDDILAFIWRNNLLKRESLRCCDGRGLRVVSPGRETSCGSGVFAGAVIETDGKRTSGNVAVSPSPKGGKTGNVILTVSEADGDLRKWNSSSPTLLVEIGREIKEAARNLRSKTEEAPCGGTMTQLPPLFAADLFTSLALERLQNKSTRILKWLELYNGDWEEVCYVSIARSLGFGINGDPFEETARRLPLGFLRKHADSLFQTEAMLFGCAGLLGKPDEGNDGYTNRLCNEFGFLSRKFSLSPIEGKEKWRFSGVRPSNFPHQRIAFLAKLITRFDGIFARITDARDASEIRDIFDFYLDDYWDTHYTFGRETPPVKKSLGRGGNDIVLINGIAPLLYAYSCRQGNDVYADRAVSLIENCRPERNHITKRFAAYGMPCDNALASQAMVELYNGYCSKRRCLECRIGMLYMKGIICDNIRIICFNG